MVKPSDFGLSMTQPNSSTSVLPKNSVLYNNSVLTSPANFQESLIKTAPSKVSFASKNLLQKSTTHDDPEPEPDSPLPDSPKI